MTARYLYEHFFLAHVNFPQSRAARVLRAGALDDAAGPAHRGDRDGPPHR